MFLVIFLAVASGLAHICLAEKFVPPNNGCSPHQLAAIEAGLDYVTTICATASTEAINGNPMPYMKISLSLLKHLLMEISMIGSRQWTNPLVHMFQPGV